jgi:hypothetical protein
MESAPTRSQAVGWHDVNRKKESFMKMHVVIAAALASLCSHAAFADPEADFWQPQESKSVTRSTQPLAVAPTANLSTLNRDNSSVYGTPAQPESTDRIVRLGPDSQSVKVAYGESVQFIVQGGSGPEQSFAWRFDGSPTQSYVDLSEVAPPYLLDHEVRVFVAPDPRHSGK